MDSFFLGFKEKLSGFCHLIFLKNSVAFQKQYKYMLIF